jgi:AcrR family transcriptional regulator
MAMRSPRSAARRDRSRSRGPGRPARRPGQGADDAVRADLLRCAEALFSRRGHAAVSVRAIAREARVSPAMIAYYFRDKAGLQEAVLDEVVERLVAQIERVAATSAQRGDPLSQLIRVYVAMLAEEPWLPAFLLREVIGGTPAARARFAKRFPARVAPLVLPIVQREIASGRLRGDLEPRLVLLSLLGLCAFPFLAQPLVGSLLGYEIEPGFVARLADHTARLFREGVQGGVQ